MVGDVVVVDVLGALPAHQGPVGAQGQSKSALVRTRGGGTRRPGSRGGFAGKTRTGVRPILRGAGARGALDHSGRLAAGGLEDPREVLVQNGLGILVGGAG